MHLRHYVTRVLDLQGMRLGRALQRWHSMLCAGRCVHGETGRSRCVLGCSLEIQGHADSCSHVLACAHDYEGETEMEILKSVKSAKWTFAPEDAWKDVPQDAKDCALRGKFLGGHSPFFPQFNGGLDLWPNVDEPAYTTLPMFPLPEFSENQGKKKNIQQI
eukprot:781037-Amphidinium_carterae.3